MKKIFITAVATLLFLVVGWRAYQYQRVAAIRSFNDCEHAGYPIFESYPAQCHTPDGRAFTEEVAPVQKLISPEPRLTASPNSICKDTCGNGKCEEVVCEASGCPCPESPASCPQDCKN